MAEFPYVDEHDFNCKNLMGQAEESFIETIRRAHAEAIREGIKVNTIVINKNMVKVPEFGMRLPTGHGVVLPTMFCGLNVYLTENELPDNYSFAVLEDPNDRLSKFEAIGMEPYELRKAAELYRQIKEAMG